MSALINYINAHINVGATSIVIPAELLAHASEEEVVEARRLCALNGAKLAVHG